MPPKEDLEDFLEICQLAANLYQEGVSLEQVAEQVHLEKSKKTLLAITVGLMPKSLIDNEIRTHPEKWSRTYLMLAASLRRIKNKRQGFFLYHAKCTEDLDFSRVIDAIHKINANEIVGVRQFETYVRDVNKEDSKTGKPDEWIRLEKRIRKQIRDEQAASIPQSILTARKHVNDAHLLRLSILYQRADLVTKRDLESLLNDIEREIEELGEMKHLAQTLPQSDVIIYQPKEGQIE